MNGLTLLQTYFGSDWLDFIASTFDNTIVFILFIMAIIFVIGAKAGSIAPGAIGAFSFLGYIGLEIDSTLVNYGLYLGVLAIMLYIAMTLSSVQMGDNATEGA